MEGGLLTEGHGHGNSHSSLMRTLIPVASPGTHTRVEQLSLTSGGRSLQLTVSQPSQFNSYNQILLYHTCILYNITYIM